MVQTARPVLTAARGRLTDAGVTVHDGGSVPAAAPPPYAVWWPEPGDVDAASLAEVSGGLLCVFTVTAAGTSADQAMWWADRCRGLLLDEPLTAPGRATAHVLQLSAAPVRPDYDMNPPVWAAPLTYRVRSVPL